jgi:aminoglycoside phosphotransferase (APT) family kinase protein
VGLPDMRDPEVTREALQAWLAAQLAGATDVAVGPVSTPAGSGFSNETLLFDATWSEGAEARAESFVIRVEPTTHRVFLDVDLERQFRVMEALGAKTDLPMPPVRWFEPDRSVLGAPFAVMSRVDGRAAPDSPPYTTEGWVVELAPEQRASMWDQAVGVLARVHTLDVDAAGVGFLRDTPYNGNAAQLELYERSHAWACDGQPNPTIDDALVWAREHLPPERRETLVWGDARPGNILFRDAAPVAVLDWEMVALGDPQLDLGWWLFLDRHQSDGYGVRNPEGIPSLAEQTARWSELTGYDAPDLHWHEVFAGIRFGVVMERLATLGKSIGMIPVDYPMELDNAVTRILANLLDLPAPADRL